MMEEYKTPKKTKKKSVGTFVKARGLLNRKPRSSHECAILMEAIAEFFKDTNKLHNGIELKGFDKKFFVKVSRYKHEPGLPPPDFS